MGAYITNLSLQFTPASESDSEPDNWTHFDCLKVASMKTLTTEEEIFQRAVLQKQETQRIARNCAKFFLNVSIGLGPIWSIKLLASATTKIILE